MGMLLLGIAVLGACVALMMIAVLFTGLGQKTCAECGGGLPLRGTPSRVNVSDLGDWACPKCGTRFDRQGRARDQFPI